MPRVVAGRLAMAVALIALLAACGGSGGGKKDKSPTPFRLSGRLGSSYATAASFGFGALAVPPPTVTQLLALPLEGGPLTHRTLENARRADVAADGSFSRPQMDP